MEWRRALGITARPHERHEQPPRGLRAVVTVVTVAALVGSASGLASADSRGIGFEASEGYVAGASIQNQPNLTPPPEGWGGSFPPGTINPLIDQRVVANWPGRPSSFGTQSWRISNAVTSGSFGDMPFSPSLTNHAGETDAQPSTYSGGVRQNQFDAQWSFTSADPSNPVENNSILSTSPDRGDGARMSYIRLEDHPGGIQVHFSDYVDAAPYGQYGNPGSAAQGCGPEDDFTDILVATVSRNQAHSVKLSIGFIDGPRNDIVRVYVDDKLRYTGTTWEDYFRWCPESLGGTGTSTDQSRFVDSLLFRVGGTAQPGNLGKGFLIDNIFYRSLTTQHDCGNHRGHGNGNNGDKKFKFDKECNNPGNDMAQHDDEGRGHHFQSSSVDSAEFESVGGGWQMTMVGSGTDNGEPVTFTIVAADALGALMSPTYSIVLSNGYSWTGSLVEGTLDIE